MPTTELIALLEMIGAAGGPVVLLIVAVGALAWRLRPTHPEPGPESKLAAALDTLTATVTAQGSLIAAQTKELQDLKLNLADTLGRHDERLSHLERHK